MNRKQQEICRDFQRGNCRFGARCKYLHITPQQQQQRNEYGGRGNYYNVLGNNVPNTNYRQPQSQSQLSAKEHRCDDLRVCKEQIKEDFANESPVFWRLTCYAHYKFLPNDIVGDVSPEELRALAYEGAKQGLSLKDLAQREASMMAAKSAEFDALLRNPYNGPAAQNASAFQPSSFSSSPFLSPPQKSSIPNSLGQPTAFSSPSTPQGFVQPPFGGTPASSFGFGKTSGGLQFTEQASNPSSGHPSPFGLQTNVLQGTPFVGVAPSSPAQQSPFSNLQGFPSTLGSPANLNAAQGVNPMLISEPPVSQTSPSTQLLPAVTANNQEDAIWLKGVWKIGEIPEGEPPPEVRF